MAILLESWQMLPMQLSPPVSRFLDVLDHLSHAAIRHRDDLGMVLEGAFRGGKERELDELVFLGKFCARAFGIMSRVGPQGEGYDRLAAELRNNAEKARELLPALTDILPRETQTQLASRYLIMTTDGLENLITLLADLSWVKNWQIDNRGKSPW
jgi:hypothetical protein